MKTYIVESAMAGDIGTIYSRCYQADNKAHAVEQAMDATPDETIISVDKTDKEFRGYKVRQFGS